MNSIKPGPVAVIGAGVIGGGWTARFMLNGIDVKIHDPNPEAGRRLREMIANAERAWDRLTSAPLPKKRSLRFCGTIQEAVDGAVFIEECIPENLELKRKILNEIEIGSATDVPIGSSTSGIRPSEMQSEMKHPERLLVTHPFNPVYLLPLVELCVGHLTDPEVIDGLAISDSIEANLKKNSGGEKHCLASMGIYVFNRETMVEALNSSATDFGKEVIPGLLSSRKLGAYVFEGYWEDIGTVKAFFEANLQLADPFPKFNFFSQGNPIYSRARYLPASKINRCSINHVIVGDGCIITDSYLKRCVIGIRSTLREGARLENVVMMGSDTFESAADRARNREQGIPDIGVGMNCEIKNAIVDKGARIGDNVRLSPDGQLEAYSKDGIFVREGIICVTKNTVVPENTVV